MPKFTIVWVIVFGLLITACEQNKEQSKSATLEETPEIVAKSLNSQQWVFNNQVIDPLDAVRPVAGTWLAADSIANHQCFNYQPVSQQTSTNSKLGISFTNLEFAKSFGVTTSLKVGLLGLGHKFKLLNTYISSENGKYNLNVTYKATVASQIINTFQGLNEEGKLYAKQGIESFVINCGSHFINSYNGTIGGLMVVTLSSTNLNSLHALEETLETSPVDFIALINQIKQFEQLASNGTSYSVKFVPYGGTVQDQTAMVSLIKALEVSPNLQACLSDLNTTQSGSCIKFIQNDVESTFINGIATIFESEVKSGNFSGVVMDDYNQKIVTSLYGKQIGFNKVDALPDPYAKFPLESQFLVAYDLTLATQLESNQVTILQTLYPLTDPDIKQSIVNMSANTAIYSNYANQAWQQIQQCLTLYQCSSSFSTPVTLLQNNQLALNNFYYLAYNVYQNLNFVNTKTQVTIPGFLYSDGLSSYVFASQMVANQGMKAFTSPLYKMYNLATIQSINNNLHNMNTIKSLVDFGALPFYSTMSVFNSNPDTAKAAKLICSLTNLTSSCEALIMTQYTNDYANTFTNSGLYIQTHNQFYTLSNPN